MSIGFGPFFRKPDFQLRARNVRARGILQLEPFDRHPRGIR